ncbi:MAG TPA: formyltransferase family protein, partial [Chitinophagales bacterium]|nr:formyltransferase family protein [Chitinophagales bacterium]
MHTTGIRKAKDFKQYKFTRIILFGDTPGILQITKIIPSDLIKGIVVSSIRPQYFKSAKRIAARLKVPILIQPKYKAQGYKKFLEDIKSLNPDFFICNSYSMLIRDKILQTVNYNAINVHWALLPKNRGPHPTQWAIIKDEKKTGITVHY